MTDRLEHMYELQRELQLSTYDIDPHALTDVGDMSYIKDMVLALSAELFELLNETTWKPWTHGVRSVTYNTYKKEIVDIWHFFMNLMIAVNMTPDELYTMYIKKRQINVNRQLDGYDGKTTKCTGCSRALEDVSLIEVKSDDSNIIDKIVCQCGVEVERTIARKFMDS